MNFKTSIILVALLACASSKALNKDQDKSLEPYRLPDECNFLIQKDRETNDPGFMQKAICTLKALANLRAHTRFMNDHKLSQVGMSKNNMNLEQLLGGPDNLNIQIIRLLEEYAEGIRSGKITTTTTTTPRPRHYNYNPYPSRYPVIRAG